MILGIKIKWDTAGCSGILWNFEGHMDGTQVEIVAENAVKDPIYDLMIYLKIISKNVQYNI